MTAEAFTGERVTFEMARSTFGALREWGRTGVRIKPYGMLAVAQEHRSRYEFAANTQLKDGDRVLEVACGTGFGADIITRSKEVTVVGGDINLKALCEVQRNHPNPRVHYGNLDAMHLPYPDKTFDAITSFETFEHLTDPDRFLQEAGRVLKVNGVLVVSTPNRDKSRPGASRQDQPPNPFHVFEVNTEEFCADLARRFGNVRMFGQIQEQPGRAQHRSLPYKAILLAEVLTGQATKVKPLQEGLVPSYLVAVCREPILK